MSVRGQKTIKENHYKEALRYISNANDLIKRAHKHGNYFDDSKYVKMASGTAYLGVLTAVEGYLLSKGVSKKDLPRSIEMFKLKLAKLDKKLLHHLNNSYDILHLAGYYGGNISYTVWKEGMEEAMRVIEKIRAAA